MPNLYRNAKVFGDNVRLEAEIVVTTDLKWPRSPFHRRLYHIIHLIKRPL